MAELAICIPTFNRAAVLRVNLVHLADLAQRHDFAVYVSDNCSTDETPAVAQEMMRLCPAIRYHRNTENVGMDGNFATVLGLPEEPYAWLLGDDDLVAEVALAEILALIETHGYDLILVNGGGEGRADGRVRGEPSRDFEDPTRLLVELGWHATWISGLIIGRRLLDRMRIRDYDGSYFSHFIALFEALETLPGLRARWHAPSSFYPSHLAHFSWSHRAIEVFASRWAQAVWAIPGDYDPVARRVCIRAHGVKTGLLTAIGLLNLRAKGGFDHRQAIQYRAALHETSPCPRWLIVGISMIPAPLVRMFRTIAMSMRLALRS